MKAARKGGKKKQTVWESMQRDAELDAEVIRQRDRELDVDAVKKRRYSWKEEKQNLKELQERMFKELQKINIFDEEINQTIINKQYAAKKFEKWKDQV